MLNDIYIALRVHVLRTTGRHLPYGITQCYLSPDTGECAL